MADGVAACKDDGSMLGSAKQLSANLAAEFAIHQCKVDAGLGIFRSVTACMIACRTADCARRRSCCSCPAARGKTQTGSLSLLLLVDLPKTRQALGADAVTALQGARPLRAFRAVEFLPALGALVGWHEQLWRIDLLADGLSRCCRCV